MCCGYSERLVTVTQIGKRLELTRTEAARLVGEAGFPAPVGTVRSSSPPIDEVALWSWPAVRRFAAGEPVACAV